MSLWASWRTEWMCEMLFDEVVADGLGRGSRAMIYQDGDSRAQSDGLWRLEMAAFTARRR